jgi:hypothetical protein
MTLAIYATVLLAVVVYVLVSRTRIGDVLLEIADAMLAPADEDRSVER